MHFKVTVVIALSLVGCQHRPLFKDKPIVWEDVTGKRAYSPQPNEHVPAPYWEAMDQSAFHPLVTTLSVPVERKAKNVNAWDEVPNSTWFENRLSGGRTLSVEQAARGACQQAIEPSGPFTVLGGKPDGMNPGFLVQAPDGKRYFFKFDSSEDQPERASAADVIGSLLYHAVGFHVPCNQIIYFHPNVLKIGPKARIKTPAGKIPMTQEHINDAFKLVKKTNDGKLRASASLFLDGKPIGPWTYAGLREGDKNDFIPHEDRREIRGSGVMSAWTNHYDVRDQNTLAMWIPKNESSGYVRFHLIDFGDCFGSLWDFEEISRKIGIAYFLDGPEILYDFITFGLVERPWDRVKYGKAGKVLGFYDVENFSPDTWKPGYSNPAYIRMTEGDAAWMARILSELSPDHIRAIVKKAKISQSIVETELTRTLLGRRKKILDRYLTILAPLGNPVVESDKLCLTDYALKSKTVDGSSYTATWVSQKGNETLKVEPAPGGLCLNLPKITQYSALSLKTSAAKYPLHLHFIPGKTQPKVVGVERPQSLSLPVIQSH